MKLLTFLTRRQAWLSPTEIAREFKLDGGRVTSRTIHRWFLRLREAGAFVYYPYPKANVLGLQDVFVRVYGARHEGIFGILPFGSSFNVEVSLGTGQPFVTQGYWVPGSSVDEFRAYWRAARDLGLVEEVAIFQSRNTHFIFSPFHEMIAEDGLVSVKKPVDNSHFEALLKRNLRGPFEVRVGDVIAKSPLVIPVVLEHIWTHFSSAQLWAVIREKGEEPIRAYLHGSRARALRRPGAALRLLQAQWASLMGDFDEVFLQPRVFFDWRGLRNLMVVSFVIRPGSVDRMVEAALRASEHSVFTTLKPGVGYEETALVSCFSPMERLLDLLDVVRSFHRDREPPVVAVQDQRATFELFQPAFCRVDWRLFDPTALVWRFDGSAYVERLKEFKPRANELVVSRSPVKSAWTRLGEQPET